jgi:hypothetical protein
MGLSDNNFTSAGCGKNVFFTVSHPANNRVNQDSNSVTVFTNKLSNWMLCYVLKEKNYFCALRILIILIDTYTSMHQVSDPTVNIQI